MTQKKTEGLRWPFGSAQVLAVRGAANGLALPSVCLLLALPPAPPLTDRDADRGLRQLAGALGLTFTRRQTSAEAALWHPEEQLRAWLNLMVTALGQVDPALDRQVANAPVLQRREGVLNQPDQPVAELVVLWPTHWPEVVAQVMVWSLRHWHELAEAVSEPQTAEMTAKAQAGWKALGAAVKGLLPPGLNPARMLTAAHVLKLPVWWLERDLVQFGQGRRARWMCSAMTDATPSIGVALARDKTRTNRLLRQLGLPVPQHTEVADAEGAVVAAGKLDWPVVVKPADQDRGDGARANLSTSEQVLAAFAHARKFSNRVLVEQHIAGREYRLTVVNGKLLWAIERVPAAVTGDGQRTLQQLIETESARRRQALLTDSCGLVPFQLDANNLSYLQENGRSLQDVPAEGEVVRLQRVPAASTGGGGRAYFDTIHPDNRLLAERAAQLLRLDIAGVDVIMPDITRSWREVGGAVTEVNAIPQVSILTDPKLMHRLLQQLMPHSGRIPLLFVLADVTPAWVGEVVKRLNANGLRIGLSTDEGLHIGEHWIHSPRTSLWDDIRALQIDPAVGAILVVGNGETLLQTGLPFDAIDALVVLAHRPQILSLMLPYARGFKAVVGEALRLQYGGLMQTAGPPWQTWASTPEAAPKQIGALIDALLAAEAVYAQATTPAGAVVDGVPSTTAFRTQALAWLLTWQDLIAAEDYEAARGLFDEAVLGYGTVAERAQGLDELVQTQWVNVWGRTRRFAFVPETLVVWPSADGSAMTVAVQWRSVGLDSRSGEPFARQGRATIVLQRHDSGWRAKHTHFSLNPAPERFLPNPTDGAG